MKEMNYSNVTARIIYLLCYTFYILDINVSYHFQTLFNRFCSFEKELNINNQQWLHKQYSQYQYFEGATYFS